MRSLPLLGAACLALASCTSDSADASSADASARLNPMITQQEAGQPVLGLYAPANRGGRGGEAPPPQKSPAELASETLGFEDSDFVFTGSMEGSVDEGIDAWSAYVDALLEAGATVSTHPLVVKAPKISDDPEGVPAGIARQLDTGVSGIMFVEVESADEVRRGLAAMRYEANGGTRPDRVGTAPEYWGVSEEEYRAKADLWPLNPDGELINWTIVESLEGLENVREIAAVEGIGVLWPGAGTLRRVFSTVGPDGARVLDEEGWEGAIQTVLAACKEFEVACGYPANADDIEMRMDQGFSVFVMGWGESGFRTIEIGRSAAGG